VKTDSLLVLPEKLRVCAYARVSTEQEEQVNSYESQVRYFTAYIRQHQGWQFCGVYADRGLSGTSMAKRAGFNQMIQDAFDGRFDLILTKEVSRFARNTVDTLSVTRALKQHGVSVFFVSDNINTADNDGELRLSIMATIAQDESRKISERVKWGQKRRMEQGVVFGRDLLGYTVRDGKLYLHQEEAEVVKLIFDKFTVQGKGTHVIARELTEAGICPKRVKKWSNTVILRVLKNEKYVGDLCQKKTCTPNYLNHAKQYNHTAEEKIYIRNHHPEIAIISRPLWERTQQELARRALSAGQKTKYSNRYWCSGKLICGVCGGRLVSRVKRLKNGEIYQAWRCQQTGSAIGDRALQAIVSYLIHHIPMNQNAVKLHLLDKIQEIFCNTSQDSNRARLLSEIEKLQRKKRKVIDFAADGIISEAELKEQTEQYTIQLNRLTACLQETEPAEKIKTAQYAARIDSLLTSAETDRQILQEVLKHAVIYPEHQVEIYLHGMSCGWRIRYQTAGRRSTFRTDILSVAIIS